MKFETCKKESFTVIGKEGSTEDGADFIKKLWENANSGFQEIADLAKRDDKGKIVGIWGAMSDFSRSFQPWENGFRQGLYLAGVECIDGSEAPQGWTKWVMPACEFLYAENESEDAFTQAIEYLDKNNIPLVGAVNDFNCPETGKGYLFLPIRRL